MQRLDLCCVDSKKGILSLTVLLSRFSSAKRYQLPVCSTYLRWQTRDKRQETREERGPWTVFVFCVSACLDDDRWPMTDDRWHYTLQTTADYWTAWLVHYHLPPTTTYHLPLLCIQVGLSLIAGIWYQWSTSNEVHWTWKFGLGNHYLRN